MDCSVCFSELEKNGSATQVFRRDGVVITITGIPAVAICPTCGNAVLEWDVAQKVEDLIQSLFKWSDSHTLPKPIVNVTLPERLPLAA